MSEIMTDLKVGGKCKKLVIATMSNKIEMKWLNWNEITLTNILKLEVVREVRHGFFSMKKKKIVLLPPNFISWRRTEICRNFFHYPWLTS